MLSDSCILSRSAGAPLRYDLEQALKKHGIDTAFKLPAWVLSKFLVDCLSSLGAFANNISYWKKQEKRGKAKKDEGHHE